MLNVGFWTRLTSALGGSNFRLARSANSTNKRTGGNRRAASPQSNSSEARQPWAHLPEDGGSSRGLAWAAGPVPMAGEVNASGELGHPLGTIQVKRTVDVV